MKIPANVKSLLRDKNVLYVVLFIALANLFGFLMTHQFQAILIFMVAGFVTSYYSKNMIVIMLTSIVVTNFVLGMKLFNRKVKEGMENKDEKKEEDVKTSEEKPTSTDETHSDEKKMTTDDTTDAVVNNTKKVENGVEKTEKKEPVPAEPQVDKQKKVKESLTTLHPASVHESDEMVDMKPKVDYAATLEAAYDNLDKMLSSDAIRSMTDETQRLAEKQKLLMNNIKQLEPMMQKAGSLLQGLDINQMGSMLDGLQSKFAMFSNIGGSPAPATLKK
jgi:hypothetical protein